ncbi:MAG: DUF3842 family protein [Gaiellales bacterium]|nr:MAG: DUF3842 family protein [Gaiellales bacterium]
MRDAVIAVIDGMGGNIGHQVVSQLRRELPESVEILVFGTNSAATANMMKARASRGATGENAIRTSISRADIIVAPIAVVIANSYMGELTPGMAEVIASSRAEKVLLPLAQPRLHFVAASRQPLPHLMEEAVARVRQLLEAETEV